MWLKASGYSRTRVSHSFIVSNKTQMAATGFSWTTFVVFFYSFALNIQESVLFNVYLDLVAHVSSCGQLQPTQNLGGLWGAVIVVWFKASRFSVPRRTTEYKDCHCHRVQPGHLCPFSLYSRAPNIFRSILLNVYLDILPLAYHRADNHNPFRVLEGYKVQFSLCGSKQVDNLVSNEGTGYK